MATVSDEELAALAVEAMENAYAPYSRFRVGAALSADGGAIFTGANVENASYGLTVCAERVAVFKAVSAGHTRITRIAVVASSADEVFPCGACRQVLNEFGPSMTVITLSGGKMAGKYPLQELLPRSFGPRNLEK
jgi:cytidine deaminase